MRGYITAITDILLGAAHADRKLVGDEVLAIRSVVSRMYGRRTLPEQRVAQIKAFDPDRFDLDVPAGKLNELAKDQRLRVLELVAMVIDSDRVIDPREHGYFQDAARALGFTDAEIGTLSLGLDANYDYSIEFED